MGRTGRPKLPEGAVLTPAERARRYRNNPKNQARLKEYDTKVRDPRNKLARLQGDKIMLHNIKSNDYKSKPFDYYARRMKPFNNLFETREGLNKIYEKLNHGNLEVKECIVNYINLVQNHGKAIYTDFVRLFSETEIKDIVQFAGLFCTNGGFDEEQGDIEQTDECNSELSKVYIDDSISSLFLKIPEYLDQFYVNTESSGQNSDQLEESPLIKTEETQTNMIKARDEFYDIDLHNTHDEIAYKVKSGFFGDNHQNNELTTEINYEPSNKSFGQDKKVDINLEDQVHITHANAERVKLDKKLEPLNEKEAAKKSFKKFKLVPKINSKNKVKSVLKIKCPQCSRRFYKKSKCIKCERCNSKTHIKCAQLNSNEENFICHNCSNDKNIKNKCVQCKKGINKDSKVISCSKCQNETHIHCAESDARVQSFLCAECCDEPIKNSENNDETFHFIEKKNNDKGEQTILKEEYYQIWSILNELGMSNFYSLFIAEKIDYAILKEMTHENLQMIGIKAFGDRHRIMKKLEQ